MSLCLGFNRRFAVPSRCSEPAFRLLDPEISLEQILCFKHRRKVDKDNTVRFQLRTLQLLSAPERPSYARATVEVLEGLDGQLSWGLRIFKRRKRGSLQVGGTGRGGVPEYRWCR